MKIRVICQICGATTVLDTERAIGPEPRWEYNDLGQFEVKFPFDNYQVWSCPDCRKKVIEGWEPTYDPETGEKYYDPIFDWDIFSDMIKLSLNIVVCDKK